MAAPSQARTDPDTLRNTMKPDPSLNGARPNFIWINTHDVGADSLGCYGNAYATTPHIDKLAKEGIRYTHAFASGPICSPARTSIFTAMHQTTVGTHHHRSFAIRPNFINLLTHYLGDAGYRSSPINTDLNTPIDPVEWEQYLDNDALLAEGANGQPFFAVYSFSESHASTFKMTPEQVRNERSNLLKPDELHDPKSAPIPSFVPDTPLARERTALFYDTLTQVDYHVGEVLSNLEKQGLSENTIVFFWTDHGTGYPRGKTHVYDDGLRVPLIVRFPKAYQHFAPGSPGSVVNDLTMTMDMGPSVLSLAGVPIPDHFQGKAFLGPESSRPREYVCGARDRLDNCNEMIRTVRDQRYRYIRNFLPHRPYGSFFPDGGFFREIPTEGTPEHAFWDTSCLPGEQKIHDPDGVFLMPLPESYSEYLIWQESKPFEELYDLEEDPEAVDNLAGNPEFDAITERMRKTLFAWMIETRDLGLIDETEMIVRAAEYDSVNYEVGTQCQNFERILETADLSRLGEEGRAILFERLDDPDSAIRYWAVTGLMSFEEDDDTIQKLTQLVNDNSLSVSLAAGDALCRFEQPEKAIATFTRALGSDLLWARCRAGANLSYYGRETLAKMKVLIPALEAALKNPSCYGDYDPDLDTLIPYNRDFFSAERDRHLGEWVLKRVIRRIDLA